MTNEPLQVRNARLGCSPHQTSLQDIKTASENNTQECTRYGFLSTFSRLILILSLFATATSFSTNPTLSMLHSKRCRPHSYHKCSSFNNHRGVVLLSTTRDDIGVDADTPTSGLKTDSTGARKVKDHLPRIVQIYLNYMRKLWRQTNREEREKIAAEQALNAIQHVKHILEGAEYIDISDPQKGDTFEDTKNRSMARDRLLEACNNMLECMDNEKVKMRQEASKAMSQALVGEKERENVMMMESGDAKGKAIKANKKSRSVLFGSAMGAIVACWVFSGNLLFTTLFTFMTILGQLEYYRMVMKTGVYPARKISVVGACAMFITALCAPNLHQICLPVFATYAMMWFLTMRRTVTTIPEIATTFTGMFYLGYIPSFWVRIRLIGTHVLNIEGSTRLGPVLAPVLEPILTFMRKKGINSPITTGSVFIFWSWISIALSDVGGYFFGRNFGKTKLGKIAPAVGAASPNKTLEGYLGGSFTSMCIATLGAWVMRWPYWYVTGPVHGFFLAFLGLVGDLTASMLKRDSGMKDFGDLLPEHGGVMDRVDSFIFTAPYSWLVIQCVIPFLKAKAKLAIS